MQRPSTESAAQSDTCRSAEMRDLRVHAQCKQFFLAVIAPAVRLNQQEQSFFIGQLVWLVLRLGIADAVSARDIGGLSISGGGMYPELCPLPPWMLPFFRDSAWTDR